MRVIEILTYRSGQLLDHDVIVRPEFQAPRFYNVEMRRLHKLMYHHEDAEQPLLDFTFDMQDKGCAYADIYDPGTDTTYSYRGYMSDGRHVGPNPQPLVFNR